MSYSKYPNQIDTSTELPIAIDRKTQVIAEVVNRLRDAVLAVESELGVNPSREYGTVRARLDAFMNMIASGPVLGPVSSTDNAIARFDGVTGTKIQDSLVIINDVGNVTTPGAIIIGTGGNGNLEASGGLLYCAGIGGTTNFDIVQRGEVDASLNTLSIVGSSSSGAGNAGGNLILAAGTPGVGGTYGTIQVGQCTGNQLITLGEDGTATSINIVTIRGADNAASKGHTVVLRAGAGTLVTDDGILLLENARGTRALGAYSLLGPSLGVVLGNGSATTPLAGEVVLDCEAAGARIVVNGTAPMSWNGNMTLGNTVANTYGTISITHGAAVNASAYTLTINGSTSSGVGNAGGAVKILGGVPGAGGTYGYIQLGQSIADQIIKLGEDLAATTSMISTIRGADSAVAGQGQNVALRPGYGRVITTDDGWLHITSSRATPGTTQTGLYISTAATTSLGGGGVWGTTYTQTYIESFLVHNIKRADNRALSSASIVLGFDQAGGVAVTTSTGLIRGADHTGVVNSKGVDLSFRPGAGNAAADHGLLRLLNHNSTTALTVDVNAYVEITSNNLYFDSASKAYLYHEEDSVGLVGRDFIISGQRLTFAGSIGGNLYLQAGTGTAQDGYLELQDAGGLAVISITPDAHSQFHSNMIMVGDYSFLPYLDDLGNLGAAGRRFSLVRAVTITSGDIGFEDDACPLCGGAFKEGDELILKVMRKEDDCHGRDISYTVPTHLRCARGD